MPKVISASEVKSQFGRMRKWAAKHNDEIIVEVHGEPKMVLMAYAKYREYQELREQARRREAWKLVEALRQEVSAQSEELDVEDSYRLAGFSDEVIEETLEHDRKLAADAP